MNNIEYLQKIKAELREFIKLSKTITPGKWFSDSAKYSSAVILECDVGRPILAMNPIAILEESKERDATFIARARNISPAMAECLLVAVEGLEELAVKVEVECSDEALRAYDQDTEIAQEKLKQILTIWEASK